LPIFDNAVSRVKKLLLEVDSHHKVNQSAARIIRSARVGVCPTRTHLSEGAGERCNVIHIACPSAKTPVRLIQNVEHRHAEFHVTLFVETNTLNDGGVNFEEVGSEKDQLSEAALSDSPLLAVAIAGGGNEAS
jgi:hypothetical protein